MEINEIEIIKKIKNGETSEFEHIITKYSKLVYSLAFRLLRNAEEADDLTQDVFFRAYRFLDKYNPEFKMSTWLSKITYNLFKDRFKVKQLNIVSNSISSDEDDKRNFEEKYADTGAGPYEKIEQSVKSRDIIAIINKLPDNYRVVVTMYFWGDYSYEEISQILEVPLGTVKSRLKRAKIYLYEKYSRLLEKWK
ncbi:MAG: RNA polymerase sigma factor [Candidatus Wallbacteria bacterium]